MTATTSSTPRAAAEITRTTASPPRLVGFAAQRRRREPPSTATPAPPKGHSKHGRAPPPKEPSKNDRVRAPNGLICFSAPTRQVHHYSNCPDVLRHGFPSGRSPPTRSNRPISVGRSRGASRKGNGDEPNGHERGEKGRGRENLLPTFCPFLPFLLGRKIKIRRTMRESTLEENTVPRQEIDYMISESRCL